MQNINSMDKNVKYELRFSKIKVIGFSQFDQDLEFDANVFPLFEFLTNVSFRVIPEHSSIACLITVELRVIETKEKFAELKVETQFEISPFESMVVPNQMDNSKFDIPNLLITSLSSFSISTVRGILFEKLKGTIAQNEIFPLMDLNSQFVNDSIKGD